jgi:RNA polymerase sigma factor (sigma-70 family)
MRQAPETGPQTSGIAIRAVSTAFQQYAPRLHRYLVRRIRRTVDVQDLTQEIFERFLRTQHLDSVRHPQAYLFRIASHVVADSLSQDERSVVRFDSEMVDDADRSLEHATPDALADRLGLAQELQRGLRELPPMHAAVLLLAVRDGLSHKEVARRTGLSVSTVGLYVCEARARIRVLLAGR